MTIQEAIRRLQAVDFSRSTEEEVKDVLNQCLELYSLPIFHIQKGSLLYRATVLKPGEELTAQRLSYCLAEKNTTYQRATCIGQTALYVTSPDPTDEKSEGNACELAMHEIWKDKYWNKETINIIFSQWEVTEDICLGAIHYASPNNYSSRLNCCANAFASSLLQEGCPLSVVQDLIAFYDFMNGQFEKPVDPNFDREYLISACFADIIKEKEQQNGNHLDGIIWESHTDGIHILGDSLSAAIYPDSVDKYLKLATVYEDTFQLSTSVKQIDSKILNINNLK